MNVTLISILQAAPIQAAGRLSLSFNWGDIQNMSAPQPLVSSQCFSIQVGGNGAMGSTIFFLLSGPEGYTLSALIGPRMGFQKDTPTSVAVNQTFTPPNTGSQPKGLVSGGVVWDGINGLLTAECTFPVSP